MHFRRIERTELDPVEDIGGLGDEILDFRQLFSTSTSTDCACKVLPETESCDQDAIEELSIVRFVLNVLQKELKRPR